MRIVIAIISGFLFGIGMGISQMMDPARAVAFMDITGVWDPTLLFVLPAALVITVISFRLILRRPHPILGGKFHLPTRSDIDRPLIVGGIIFGIGWGIAGYCPGTAIAAAAVSGANPLIFIVAMVAGSLTYKWVADRNDRKLNTASVPSVSVTSNMSE